MMLAVRPAPGRRVRDPETAALLTRAARVPATAFWLRRLQDGDVLPNDAKTKAKGKGPA